MSGLDNNSLHNATRLFSPPDRCVTVLFHDGKRSASAAISNVLSICHPSTASISFWRVPCLSSKSFISSSLSGSANFSLIALNSERRSMIAFMPSSTFPLTSFDSSRIGSCGR